MAKVCPCYLSLDICSNMKQLSGFLKERRKKTCFNKNKAVDIVIHPNKQINKNVHCLSFILKKLTIMVLPID